MVGGKGINSKACLDIRKHSFSPDENKSPPSLWRGTISDIEFPGGSLWEAPQALSDDWLNQIGQAGGNDGSGVASAAPARHPVVLMISGITFKAEFLFLFIECKVLGLCGIDLAQKLPLFHSRIACIVAKMNCYWACVSDACCTVKCP